MITLQVVKTKSGRTGVTFVAADNEGVPKKYLLWEDSVDGPSITDEKDRSLTKTVIAELKVSEMTANFTLSTQVK